MGTSTAHAANPALRPWARATAGTRACRPPSSPGLSRPPTCLRPDRRTVPGPDRCVRQQGTHGGRDATASRPAEQWRPVVAGDGGASGQGGRPGVLAPAPTPGPAPPWPAPAARPPRAGLSRPRRTGRSRKPSRCRPNAGPLQRTSVPRSWRTGRHPAQNPAPLPAQGVSGSRGPFPEHRHSGATARSFLPGRHVHRGPHGHAWPLPARRGHLACAKTSGSYRNL